MDNSTKKVSTIRILFIVFFTLSSLFFGYGAQKTMFALIPMIGSVVFLGYSVGPVLAGRLASRAGMMFIGGDRVDDVPLLSEAQSTVVRGDFDGAIVKYLEIIDAFPDEMNVYRELFILYRRLHKHVEAKMLYKRGYYHFVGDKRVLFIRIYREEKPKSKFRDEKEAG